MMRSHRARAFSVRKTLPPNTRSQSASSLTAFMKASVTSTETLNMRSRLGSRLASTKSSMSGWSQRSVAIMAPRRQPALMMVRHIESQTSMKESGPEASAPTPFTGAPRGRSVEKSCPMPPPCCMVSAASRRFSKMPDMSSGMAPMTKQLNSVTLRPVPAPAITRPAGRNLKSCRASWKRPAHSSGSRSGTAKARATRHQVASRSASAAPEASRKRYFMSQMRWETGAQSIVHSPVSDVLGLSGISGISARQSGGKPAPRPLGLGRTAT